MSRVRGSSAGGMMLVRPVCHAFAIRFLPAAALTTSSREIGRKSGKLFGKSPYLQSVNVDGPESLVGSIVDVKISQTSVNSMHGSALIPEPLL